MTNNVFTKAASFVIAVTATTLSFAEITHAQTFEFTYSPEEITTANGVADLDKRLSKFARRACYNPSPIVTVRMERECREEIEAQVRAKIDNLVAQELNK